MVDDLMNSWSDGLPVVLEENRKRGVGKELRCIQKCVLVVDVQIHCQTDGLSIVLFHTLNHTSVEYSRTDRSRWFFQLGTFRQILIITTIHNTRSMSQQFRIQLFPYRLVQWDILLSPFTLQSYQNQTRSSKWKERLTVPNLSKRARSLHSNSLRITHSKKRVWNKQIH